MPRQWSIRAAVSYQPCAVSQPGLVFTSDERVARPDCEPIRIVIPTFQVCHPDRGLQSERRDLLSEGQASPQVHPLAFANRFEVTLQRPDKLGVITLGNGPASEFYYNGKTMTAFAPAENLIAVADAPPAIEHAGSWEGTELEHESHYHQFDRLRLRV